MEKCDDNAKKLVDVLKSNNFHIATAESCTGGIVAAKIVDVPGASEVFEEGYITYSDRVKMKLLNVKKETVDKYTVVSAEAAKEMADGACSAAKTDIAVSVTGYAGPDDSNDGTKAGTVYVGTFFRGKSEAEKFCFKGGRQRVREQAADKAIECVLERLIKGE